MRFTNARWLEKNWERARTEGIAMMTYNPAIGRVLEPGGVAKFKKLAHRAVRELRDIADQRSFDRFHHRLVRRLHKTIRTRERRIMSYGQAQKAVNVFLKVYVDWAKLPDVQSARRLGRCLHVPLDSVVMGCVRQEHRKLFDQIVAPVYRKAGEWPSDVSLITVTYRLYRAWQKLFRLVRPRRPIDLDVIWSRAPRE